MRPHAVAIWFFKSGILLITVAFITISLAFFPKIYSSSFFVNNYFGLSFLIVFVLCFLFSIQSSSRKTMNEIFEEFSNKNGLYIDRYKRMKLLCDTGNIKKDILKDFDGAIADYTEAIEINANYASLYFNRGTALLNKLEFEKAIDDFDSAIYLEANNAEFYNGRATAKMDKGDLEGAKKDFFKSIELNPEDTTTILLLNSLIKKSE